MDDLRKLLDISPLSRAQVIAISLTAIINAVDGYDVLAMTFAAPAVSADWGIDKAALGLTLSSGFVGMTIGSFLLAPLGDRFGRRKIILTTLALMAAGMLMAALSRNVVELALWRVVTGLGIGALVPINTPLAVEYANVARRRLALAVMAVGFPLGGTLGGFAAAALLHYSTWHSVFLLGSALSAILFAVAYLWLPEPPAFLLARRPADALPRLNQYLVRCGHAPIAALPEVVAMGAIRSPYRAIFSSENWVGTVTISLCNFLYLVTVYYVLSWMPQLVADLGYSSSFATLASSTAALFGIGSSLLCGLIGRKWPLRVLAAINATGLATATIVFGLGGFGPVALLVLVAVVGVFLYAGTTTVYGVIIDTFAPSIRATGAGFAMGIGRIAGVTAPAFAGLLFFLGMHRLSVSIILSLCAFTSAVLLLINNHAAQRRA